MNLTQFKHLIKQLDGDKRVKLSNWLQGQILKDQDKQRHSTAKKKETVEEKPVEHKTYRKEMVRCGKETCKCNDGKLHGPYYYAYWSEQGSTKSQYIGKKPPKEVQTQRKRAK